MTFEVRRDERGVECPSEFFFVGSAWGCAYYCGAYRAMLERWGKEHVWRHCKFGGNSSGALCALAMALDKSPDQIDEIYEVMIRYANKYGVFGKMSIYHDYIIDMIFNGDNHAYQRCNDRLFVGITRFPSKYHTISRWESNDELRVSLHTSMHIPFYMSNIDRMDRQRGSVAIDGCFSNFYCKYSNRTLVVSPYHEWLNGDVCCGLQSAFNVQSTFSSVMSDFLSLFRMPAPVLSRSADARKFRRMKNRNTTNQTRQRRRRKLRNPMVSNSSSLISSSNSNSSESDLESDMSNLSLMNCFQNDEEGYLAMKNIGYVRMMAWDGRYSTKTTKHVPRLGVSLIAFMFRLWESICKFHSGKMMLFSLIYTFYFVRKNQILLSKLHLI